MCETLFEPFSVNFYPYVLKRRSFQDGVKQCVHPYVEQIKEALESFANLRKNSQLSSLKAANRQLSIFWKGKGYVELGVIVWKNKDKPIRPFFPVNRKVLSPRIGKVVVVTAAQLNLAEFCLSFKEKLRFAIAFRKKILRSYSFVCSFVTKTFKTLSSF